LIVKVDINRITDRTLKGGVIKFYETSGTQHLEVGRAYQNNTENVRLSYTIKPDNAIRSGTLTVVFEVVAYGISDKNSKPITIKIPYKINPPRPPKDTEVDKLYKEIKETDEPRKRRITNCLRFINKFRSDNRKGDVEKVLTTLYGAEFSSVEKNCEGLEKFKKEYPNSEKYGRFITKAVNEEKQLKCGLIAEDIIEKPEPVEPIPATPKEVTQAEIDNVWKKTETVNSLAAYQKFITDFKSQLKAKKYITTARLMINEISGKDDKELTTLKIALEKNKTNADKCIVCLAFLKKEPAAHYVKMRKEAEKGKKNFCNSYISLSTLEGLVNVEISWQGLKEFDIEVLENRGEGFVSIPMVNLAFEDKLEGSTFKRIYKYVEGVSHKFIVKDKNGELLGEPKILALAGEEGIFKDGEKIRIQGGYHPLTIQWVTDDKRNGFIDLSKIGEDGQRVFELNDLGLLKGTYAFTALSNNTEIGDALKGVELRSKGGWLRWAILGTVVFVLGLTVLVLGKGIKEKAADYAIFRTMFDLTKKSTKKAMNPTISDEVPKPENSIKIERKQQQSNNDNNDIKAKFKMRLKKNNNKSNNNTAD
jgi:hypothetical protein